MKQTLRLPRLRACCNCGGRSLLEFDRLDVMLGAGVLLRFSSVPYHQCRECDHRDLEPRSRTLLEAEMAELERAFPPGSGELLVNVHWKEVLSLDLDLGDLGGPFRGSAQDRLFEVDWELLTEGRE